MPESFDTLLSQIAESAATSVHPAGPTAARQRGHRLAMRRRAIVSVMSVILLGGGGGLAFALANHSGTPAPITHTGTPTPGTSSAPASPSPSGPPSPTVSGGASGSASATSSAVTGDLNTIVPGAWTPVSQFPFSFLNWKANMNQPAIHTADRQWFYTCFGSGTTLSHLGAVGYQEISYSATSSSAQAPAGADQVMFFFPSATAAEQALTTVQHDYANCPEQKTGLNGVPMTGTVRQTEQLDGSYAWLHTFVTANGNPGDPADIATDNHEFFVQRGNVLELVWFGGGTEFDQQSEDLGFLNRLNAGMCVYGGTCPASAQPLTTTITAAGSTSLVVGGDPVEFDVTVTNNSNGTISNVTPIVSLSHCTCVNTPVPMMPSGVLQIWDTSGSAWKDVLYNREGSGMDYVMSSGAVQVPAFDLAAGQSVSFKYRVRLNPASANNLSGQFHLTNGTSAIDVSLVHPQPQSGSIPAPNTWIGTTPAALIPVTVTVN